MILNIQKFQKIQNIKFKNNSLLIEALTHKSANKKFNNEKLEFLGDRVIGLILARKLIDLYPDENEGVLDKTPKRGDVIVFKTPADNRTDYIKRLIGLPGDEVQIINKDLYLNDIKIEKEKIETSLNINCGNEILHVDVYEETLPNGRKYLTVYRKEGTMKNSDKFIVPINHYFFLGDNRDCSKDSRFLSSVGYVGFNNLLGKAQLIFFSNDSRNHSFFQFWKWNKSIRLDRFFKKIN